MYANVSFLNTCKYTERDRFFHYGIYMEMVNIKGEDSV